jgi:DNA-nicking Smr family endonuclease
MNGNPAKPAPAEPDDDTSLFRAAMAGVRRRAPSNRAEEPRAAPAPVARQRAADDRAVLEALLDDPDPELLESGDTLSYKAAGVQDGVLRRLKRGQFRIEKELDLHGMNRERARAAVSEFLAYCRDRNLRGLRIVHGKGNGSPNSGPILKTLLESWLRRSRDVLAFCSARPVDGGTGAVYVLLRGSPGPARS